jgi:hypothetical protein
MKPTENAKKLQNSNNSKSNNEMNATLSQNVLVMTYNEMPPTLLWHN